MKVLRGNPKQAPWPSLRHSAFRVPRSAFTLVEMLVVMAVIGVLVTILWAAVQKAVLASNNNKAKSDMRELLTAFEAYLHKYEKFPLLESDQGSGTIHVTPTNAPDQEAVYDLLQGGNPEGIHFLHRELPADRIMRDPWGTPYEMWFDANYDGTLDLPESVSAVSWDDDVTKGFSVPCILRSRGRDREPDYVEAEAGDDIWSKVPGLRDDL